MSCVAALTFAGSRWLTPAAIAAVLGLVLVLLSYFRAHAPARVRLACAALKALGLLALLACFLEPLWTSEHPKPGANKIALVIDNSESLRVQGKGEKEPRGEAIRHILLGEGNAWRQQLAHTFDLQGYLVDSRLQTTADFHELDFNGHASRVGSALRTLAANFRGQPLAGIVLLTDGSPTDLRLEELPTDGLPPIFPVLFGSQLPERDLAITNTSVSQTSFEDAPVTVMAEVSATGFNGQAVIGTLTLAGSAPEREKETVVATQALTPSSDGEKLVFRFQYRPEKFGTLFYHLRVAGKATPPREEATAANNETIVTVERKRGPYRILYVSGRPNWEYKFLHRAIEEDEQTQLVALMRVARREAKFEFRGRAGESSNPLFRGFGQQSPDEVERYDQPVFVRLNTRDESELRGGFPRTAEELFGYHAIILDDLEAEFFTPKQQALVGRFVSERGGGLLMLGGMESFGEGKYERTAIGDLLPVYLHRQAEAVPPPKAQLRMALTREGWLQPWVRLRANEAADRARLAEVPPFDLLNATSAIKPGATILATVTDGQKLYPALATQRFGRGRSAALLIGDLFHAGLGDEARMRDLGESWRQMLRWLVSDVPETVELRAEPAEDGQSMRLDLRVRDAKFLPQENAEVSVKVTRTGSGVPPVTMTAEASPTEPGLYQTSYLPRETGGYLAEAEVTRPSDAAPAGSPALPPSKAETGWSTDFAAAEFRALAPNRPLMEELARRTGGKVLAPEDLGSLAREFPERHVPVVEIHSRPLWHTPYFFLFALGCLIAEWGLRRKHGLA